MGCEFNYERLAATTGAEALVEAQNLIAQARYECGHGGYTGSFAECTGIELVSMPAGEDDPEDFLDRTCEKWGPMLIVFHGGRYHAGGNCSS